MIGGRWHKGKPKTDTLRFIGIRMCQNCVDGEVTYKLPLLAPQFNRGRLVGHQSTCLVPCCCSNDLILRQIPTYPAYLADQRGGIYYIKDGQACRLKVRYHGDLMAKIYTKEGRRVQIAVASLVLQAFGCQPYRDEYPWFRDSDRQNVALTNLEWRCRRLI